MKRFLTLMGVAVVAAAMYVAASPASRQASRPTAKQFKALKAQVTALGHTVKGLKAAVAAETKLLKDCVQFAAPVGDFGNPTGNPAEGYHYLLPSHTPTEILTTALDLSNPSDPNTAWFVGAAPGQTACATDLGEPTALRHGAAEAGFRMHASSRIASFVAHGR